MPKKNPVTKPTAKSSTTKKPATKKTATKAPTKKATAKKAPAKAKAKNQSTARGGKPGPRQPKLDISELHNPAANQVRKLRGSMSQPEFAEKSGLKYAPAVARIENPEYLSTSTSTLLRIAKSLGKTLVIGFIDEGEDNPFPEYVPEEPAPKTVTEDGKGAPAKTSAKKSAKKATAKKPAAKKSPARKAPVKKTAAKKAPAKKAPARRKTAKKA